MGVLHVAVVAGAAASLPLAHKNAAEPVARPVASLTAAMAPDTDAAALAAQVLPPTFQLTTAAGQAASGVGTGTGVVGVAALAVVPVGVMLVGVMLVGVMLVGVVPGVDVPLVGVVVAVPDAGLVGSALGAAFESGLLAEPPPPHEIKRLQTIAKLANLTMDSLLAIWISEVMIFSSVANYFSLIIKQLSTGAENDIFAINERFLRLQAA